MGKISVKIIKESGNYTVLQCARCDGSGKMVYKSERGLGITSPKKQKKQCNVCGGAGKIKITQTPPFEECNQCDATGTKTGKTMADRKTCPGCDGIGVISANNLRSY